MVCYGMLCEVITSLKYLIIVSFVCLFVFTTMTYYILLTGVSKSMEKIIREMIAKDYKIRPSAVKILHHPKLRAITKQDKKDYARVDYVVCISIDV